MKNRILASVLLSGLAGCQTAPVNPTPNYYVAPEDFCSTATRLAGSPYLTDFEKRLLFSKMDNQGCLD